MLRGGDQELGADADVIGFEAIEAAQAVKADPAQVSTRPTSGAEELANMAGRATARMVRCWLLLSVATAVMVRESLNSSVASCIFAMRMITMLCEICVIICNENRDSPVKGIVLPG